MSAGEDKPANTEGENLDSPEPSGGGARENGSGEESIPDGSGSVPPNRKGTGPRTQQGKERSKHNALKHGIFSKVVLLNNESETEFDSLLNGLLNALQAEGALEEILVEKLATHIWRYRRLLIAETAEVLKGTEVDACEKFERDRQEGEIFLRSEEKSRSGLLLKKENPFIRNMCLKTLEMLKDAITLNGFEPAVDTSLLRVLFGDTAMEALSPIVLSYKLCSRSGECPLPEGSKELRKLKEKLATPEERKAKFLQDLRVEIYELNKYAEEVARFTFRSETLNLLRGKVPDAPELDRLLRYEASLDRSFDRTLSQLERRQRMRLGQPVLPNVEVHHSMS